MKIERLIQIFEQLLPIYEKGYRERYSWKRMIENSLEFGLCKCAWVKKICSNYYELSDLFDLGYYSNLTDKTNYLFYLPSNYKDLKPRIDFMKSEIKSLKKLLKQGYTHV